MKRIIFSFLFFCFIFGLQAQLLWKISGNKLKQPSYLFGTHHLVTSDYLDSIPNIYKSFNSTNVVVGEMLMNDIDAAQKITDAHNGKRDLKCI